VICIIINANNIKILKETWRLDLFFWIFTRMKLNILPKIFLQEKETKSKGEHIRFTDQFSGDWIDKLDKFLLATTNACPTRPVSQWPVKEWRNTFPACPLSCRCIVDYGSVATATWNEHAFVPFLEGFESREQEPCHEPWREARCWQEWKRSRILLIIISRPFLPPRRGGKSEKKPAT